MKKKINEDASMGSVGAQSIAGNRGYSIFGQRSKPMRRSTQTTDIPVISFKHDNRRWLTKFRRAPLFSFIQHLDSMNENFNLSDALSKLNNAVGQSKTNEDKSNTVKFGLEDDKGHIIKVFVDSNDADAFEEALSRELEDGMKKIEIAELLFKLRDEYSITNVVWPKIVDDVVEEEESTKLPQDEGGDQQEQETADQSLADDFSDEDNPDEQNDTGEETTPHQAGENDILVDDLEAQDDFSSDDSKQTLNAILSMLASDAEAKKAEADARAAEARAKEAEAMARTAEARIKSEEQILDMETYNKQKSNEKSEVRKLAKLAQYRHEMKRQQEQDSMASGPNVVNIDTTDSRRYAGEEEEENSQSVSVNTLLKLIKKMQTRENAQE